MDNLTPLDSKRLLADVKVVELSTRVSGAYCSRLLMLMGATVVRINTPLAVDCPPELSDDVLFAFNAGKEYVDKSASNLDEILGSADVLVVDCLHDDPFDGAWTEFAKRLVNRLPASLPVVDISTFRPSTETESSASTPLTANAMSGMMWAQGHPGMEPLAEPYDLADYFAGTQAAGAAALSIVMRDQGYGEPLRWDISSADAMAYHTGQITSNFLRYERPWMRDGARATKSGGFYPSAMFPTIDGFITLVCRSPREWDALRQAMGNPPWSQRPEFQDARIVARDHADEADSYVSAWTSRHTSAEITEIAEKVKLPHAVVLRPDQALSYPQFVEHGLFVEDRHGRPSIPDKSWRVFESASPGASGRAWALSPSAEKPLAGLRILDLTWVWAGPMVTAALADLGAEVIKVESTSRPDSARLRGAARENGEPLPGPDHELSPYFNQMNRGKRSVTINIASSEGADLVRKLAAECDVVIENMRPGALDRRGLGYAELSRANPSILMVSMSMMGQFGPMSGLGGYAPVMSGLAGLDAITGYSNDDPIGNFNPSLGDPNGADHALALLVAGLHYRAQTGRGAWLDLAQTEALTSVMRVPFTIAATGREVPAPANSHSSFGPHGVYRCSGDDDWVAIAVRTDSERARLAVTVGAGGAPAGDLESRLIEWVRSRPKDEVEATLRSRDLAVSAVLGVEAMIDSEWARARGLWRQYDHPFLGNQKIFVLPWKMNGCSFAAPRQTPLLGADNEEVLIDMFNLIDSSRLQELQAAGAIS